MSQTFAIAPGTQIVNSASITFDLRGRTYVVSDADTLIAASDSGNSPPHTLNLDATSIPENALEIFVGRLAALDVDPADTLEFSTADTRFRVVGDVLFLAPGVSFDFETTTEEARVQFKVRDTYGGELIREFIIPITNVNETPFELAVPGSAAPADIAGAVIGPVTALDPDVGDTLTYAVDDSRFLVANGELRLSAGQLLGDGEQVTLTITATDSGGLAVARPVNLRASRFASQRSSARIGRIDPLGQSTALSLAQCGALAAPGVSLVLPANYNVVYGEEIRADEPVVQEIVDADANLDRAAVDGLFARFRGANGDEEVIRLLETGVDTGVFTAVTGLTSSASGRDDCRLAVRDGDQLRLDYVDARDARDALDQAVATASVRLIAVPSTTASIALLANAQTTTGALNVHIEASRCGGSVSAPPRDREGNNIPLPADPSLQPSSAFLVGDTVFVRVTDLDENRDSTMSEQLEVVIRSALDEETVVLNETAENSGIFTGYVNTSDTLSAACALSTVGHTVFSVSYVDADDAADSIRAEGFVTGFVRVFSASTGALVDGALVSLVDATTGLPATGAVAGLDGSSESPASVRSGQSVSDSGGRTYQLPAGAVLFPRVRAGRYRLQVVPAGNYSFPSSRSDAQIELLGAGRYRLASGSRGAEFTVDQDGNAGFDIPLDPLATGVFVTKEASTEVMEVGDLFSTAFGCRVNRWQLAS